MLRQLMVLPNAPAIVYLHAWEGRRDHTTFYWGECTTACTCCKQCWLKLLCHDVPCLSTPAMLCCAMRCCAVLCFPVAWLICAFWGKAALYWLLHGCLLCAELCTEYTLLLSSCDACAMLGEKLFCSVLFSAMLHRLCCAVLHSAAECRQRRLGFKLQPTTFLEPLQQ